jgi:hypothetical protein
MTKGSSVKRKAHRATPRAWDSSCDASSTLADPSLAISRKCVKSHYALSASPLSQADMPCSPALRLYSAFSDFVQRTWICSVARSLAGNFGRPLPRFGAFMWLIMAYTNNPCNPSLGMI